MLDKKNQIQISVKNGSCSDLCDQISVCLKCVFSALTLMLSDSYLTHPKTHKQTKWDPLCIIEPFQTKMSE